MITSNVAVRVMLCTSGSGTLFDICLKLSFFRAIIAVIVCDRECKAQQVAEKYGIPCVVVNEPDDFQFNQALLQISEKYHVKYVLSYSFLRLFRANYIKHYPNNIFNSHFSLLPAFKGYYDLRDKSRSYPAKSIFERTMGHRSLVTGNTIHLVNEEVDDGAPLLVSLLAIDRHNMSEKAIRHQLFIQECKSILQFCKWLSENRILCENNDFVIKDAKYSLGEFIPNIDDQTINTLIF